MNMEMPDFSPRQHFITDINNNLKVANICNATSDDFEKYCYFFEKNGFEEFEKSIVDFHFFKGYKKDDCGVFINYFKNTNELTVSIENNCTFPKISNEYKTITVPQITQIHLEDFGMSYVIRLSDGRFIVIDGGWNFKPDAEKLYKVLKDGSNGKKPTVAAWIMTHAHIDHFRCFNTFTDLYGEETDVECFMFNFPDHESLDVEYFSRKPALRDPDYSYKNTSERAHIGIMLENIKKYNAPIYTPHTGETYRFGDAVIEILACVDDTYHLTGDSNSYSLIFRMELGRQVIMWTGDASFSHANLASRYGAYLKSDIMQVPHHGFASGDSKGHIATYELIKPDVCLLPVSEHNAYVLMDTYIEPSEYLMKNLGIKELITGDTTTTLTLPYTPPSYAQDDLLYKYNKGRRANGSEVWMVTGLNTENKDDFKFELLNFSSFDMNVSIDLIFETSANFIGGITTILPRNSVKSIDILNKDGVVTDSLFFNWLDIDLKGIPENSKFAIRFLSDRPFAVSCKNGVPAYHF